MIYTIMETEKEPVEVVGEIGLLLKLYSDGSVVRSPNPTTPASSQFTDGVASKDVVINPVNGVWARIFKPETASQKSPLVIYFHGGGFAVCSTAWVEFHAFLHRLCKTAGVVILSADYRLAPENRLPAAYDDCTEAVEWASKHAAGKAEVSEEWLLPSTVDFSRCFLAGESAGGNIVHHVGLRVADMDLKALKVKGLIALHPFFGSEEMADSEKGEEMEEFVDLSNFIWSISLPAGSDRNHPYCNLAVSPIKDVLQLPPVLVGIAGKDKLKERGMMYYEYLKKCGKEAELLLEESGIHAYHLYVPEFEGTTLLIERFSNFIDTH